MDAFPQPKNNRLTFQKVRFQIPDALADVPSALPSCRNSEASADRAIWRGGPTPSPEYSKIPDRPLWQVFGRSEIASHATHLACLITRRLHGCKIKILVESACIRLYEITQGFEVSTHRWDEGNGVMIGTFYLTLAHVDSGEKIEFKKVNTLIAIYPSMILTLVRG